MKNNALPAASTSQQSRRQFLKTSAGLGFSAAGMALLGACGSVATPNAHAETLETTTLRLNNVVGLCLAAHVLAEDMLKDEGFTDVRIIKDALGPLKTVASGEADIDSTFSAVLVRQLDAGDPIVVLGGLHTGCFELFGTPQIKMISDLKGKTIAVAQLGSSQHVFLSSMLAYVGLDPAKNVTWVTYPFAEAMKLLAEGKIDAYMAFPPESQELRAKQIGQVVVNSMMDKPWSQYFCCMVAANRDFVKKNPVATKRALRAFLKAADICALQPERAARIMVDKGYTDNYDYALDAMHNVAYNRWREYDPEDTLRFYALRLHEAGMVKSGPDEIIARGADWSFLNQIKQEMKG
jgi:NitT/TauT family transport system substrate-binding protein